MILSFKVMADVEGDVAIYCLYFCFHFVGAFAYLSCKSIMSSLVRKEAV
jgi:hypothetical protein